MDSFKSTSQQSPTLSQRSCRPQQSPSSRAVKFVHFSRPVSRFLKPSFIHRRPALRSLLVFRDNDFLPQKHGNAGRTEIGGILCMCNCIHTTQEYMVSILSFDGTSFKRVASNKINTTDRKPVSPTDKVGDSLHK